MNLTDKITSLEEYLSVKGTSWSVKGDYKVSRGFIRPSGVSFSVLLAHGEQGSTEYIPDTLWWVHREMLRQVYEVYPAQTRILKALSTVSPQYQHLMLHISVENPEMIAFTASPEDGMRDRQTKMAFGRFLRKYNNWATDKTIAEIEAAHRTEMNPPISFIVAEKEKKEFVAAYRAINSCMSKSLNEYPSTKGMHPVEAYCAPGWQLAIMKNSDGRISARSLVWINPEDETDKRMVRTYGDSVLDSWLKQKGFKVKNFVGAWLVTKVISDSVVDGQSGIVVPYVDPGTINGNTVSDQNGQGVWDGADRVYLTDSKMRSRIPTKYNCSVQAASGHTTAHPFPINRKCAITGAAINGIKDAFVDVWYDEKKDIALATAVAQHGWVKANRGNGTEQIYHAPSTPTFMHGSVLYVKCEAVYKKLGWIKLVEKYYGEREWEPIQAAYVRTEAGWIMLKDACYFINDVSLRITCHESEVPKDAERLAAIDDIKTYGDASLAPRIVRTAANRRVIPGIHPVGQAYNGEWHYTRQMSQTTIMGEVCWLPPGKTISDIELNDLTPNAKARMIEAVHACAVHGNARKRALFSVFASRGDMLAPLADGPDGKLIGGYIFEYTKLPMKLITAWLDAPYVEGRVLHAPDSKMRELHKFGQLALRLADEEWAKAHPKGAKAPEPAVTA